MPIFEYACRHCGHRFEELVRGAEPSDCPQCRRAELERLVSSPAAARVGRSTSLPIAGGCPPEGSPPCGPGCCRL